MHRIPAFLALTALLLVPCSSIAAQSTATEEEDPLAPFVELSTTEGPAAAIAALEAEARQRALGDQEKIFLGILLFTVGRADESYATLEPFTRSEEASAPVLFNAWRAADASGRGTERLDLLQRAAELAPVSPAGRQLGFVFGNEGRLQDAYLLLVPWARSQPEDVEARLAAAHAALQLERVPVAEEMLSDLPQDIPQVRLLWGKLLFLRGDPHGALATLKAMGEGEDLQTRVDLDRRHTMANAYISIGEAEQAVELLEGRTGDDPRMVMVLGRAQSQSGQMEESLATLRPLAEAALEGNQPLATDMAAALLLDYGRALIGTGSPEEAINPLQVATDVDPSNEMAWQSLGQALAVAGRREEAAAALERFNELAQNAIPSHVQATTLERDVDDPTGGQLRQALILAGQGRPEEALVEARSERTMSPADPRVPLVESQILVMLEQPEQALLAAGEAVDMAPDFADGYYQRGVVLMGLHRYEPAEQDFRRALEITPTHTPTLNDLAVLLMFLERNDEAKELLERALEINPDDALAAGNLAELES